MLPTKILRDFITAEKREEKIPLLWACSRARSVQAAELDAIAKLPKKEVLIAMLLSAMQGPIRGVVYTLSGVLANLCESLQPLRIKGKGRETCQQPLQNCHRKN